MIFYEHVFMEAGHVLMRALEFEVKGLRWKWRLQRLGKKDLGKKTWQLEEKCIIVGLSKENVIHQLN